MLYSGRSHSKQILGYYYFDVSIVICRATWCTFKPNLEKIKKNPPRENLLYFKKWNFLTPRLKNALYFELFSHMFLFQEITFQA